MADKPVDDSNISTLRAENSHEIVENFTTRFRQANNPTEKNSLVSQLVETLKKIDHQSESAQDLYDLAENLYFAGEVVEDFNEQAMETYKDSLEIWQRLLESLYLLGKFYEIAEIHINIARIFGEKLDNQIDERMHLHEAIILFIQEAQLSESLGNSARAAQIYFIIGDLYRRVEDWDAAILSFSLSTKMAKALGNLRLFFNATENLARIYRKIGKEEEFSMLLSDAVDTLLNEAEQLQDSNNEVQMAEIYQFIKKVNLLAGNMEESGYFSKKEAAEYIKLAKSAVKENQLPKAGALYRGALMLPRNWAIY